MSSPEEMIKGIDAVTKEDIVAVAKDIFKPENLNFAMIGPVNPGDITEADLSF